MRRVLLILPCLLAATPLPAQRGDPQTGNPTGQDADGQPLVPPPASVLPFDAGRVAASPVGEAGLRRTQEQVEGIAPLARIDTRIQNRVQSRIRNRVDRNYDPQANAASPLAIAENEFLTTRRTGR